MPFTPNRRSFIIASGMTALASTRVLGANDTLRVGVIGAGGRMGTLLVTLPINRAFRFSDRGGQRRDGPRRDEVKARSNGIATTHLDYHEVLEKDVDAVLVTHRVPRSLARTYGFRTPWLQAKTSTWRNP